MRIERSVEFSAYIYKDLTYLRMKSMEYLPHRPLKRLMKRVGVREASPDAVDALGVYLEEEAVNLIRRAKYSAHLGRRVRLLPRDIEMAIQQKKLRF
jgi:histone H3/H4